MAQTALPAPRTRRRVLGGLLDADGWTWAGLKALFWFVVIILLLGYIPDRAYYFTVQKTVDVGLLIWSPINFCPPENETLPCPVPASATLPWHPAPEQLRLPAARTDGVGAVMGQTYLYAGGSDGNAAVADVYFSRAVGSGNVDVWAAGPSLPEPRSDAASVVIGNTLYVLGGTGADGNPTDTVYSLTLGTDGSLPDAWTAEDALKLPEPLTGAGAVAVSDGIVVAGGKNADTAVSNVWKTKSDTSGKLGPWVAQNPLYEAVADSVAVHQGDTIFVIGGTNADGAVVSTVQLGTVGGLGAPADDPNTIVALWRVSPQTNLPGPRTDMSGFAVNGALYVQGGSDGVSPRTETLWTTPDASGVITGWKHLAQTDLGEGLAGSAAVVASSNAFLMAGETPDGLTPDIARANMAPQEPFFQLGLFGATLPALKLDGEVGQQIGYLNAATVGAINFILLIIIGYLYNHPAKARALWSRIRRR
jgi:N-acetylneuraminic acid mutarotase